MSFLDRINITQKIGLLLLVISSLSIFTIFCITISEDEKLLTNLMECEIEYSSNSNIKEVFDLVKEKYYDVRNGGLAQTPPDVLQVKKIIINTRGNIQISFSINSKESMWLSSGNVYTGDKAISHYGSYREFKRLIKTGSLEELIPGIEYTKSYHGYISYSSLKKMNYDSFKYTSTTYGYEIIILIFSTPILGLMLLVLFGRNKLNLFQKINLTLFALLQPGLLIYFTFLFPYEKEWILVFIFPATLFLLNAIIFKSRNRENLDLNS